MACSEWKCRGQIQLREWNCLSTKMGQIRGKTWKSFDYLIQKKIKSSTTHCLAEAWKGSLCPEARDMTPAIAMEDKQYCSGKHQQGLHGTSVIFLTTVQVIFFSGSHFRSSGTAHSPLIPCYNRGVRQCLWPFLLLLWGTLQFIHHYSLSWRLSIC